LVGVTFLFGCCAEIDDVQQKEQKYVDMQIVQACYADECDDVISETISPQEFKK